MGTKLKQVIGLLFYGQTCKLSYLHNFDIHDY